MKLPYGVADFFALRTEGQVYVDRTDRIAWIEELGKTLLFLRPRRFGKSLWLSTLAAYYDLRLAEAHGRLFRDLAVGEETTPLAHRYFVLTWDFSEIDPDPPPRGALAEASSRHQRIANEINRYLNSTVRSFRSDYREYLTQEVRLEEDAFSSLDRLLDAVRQTPYEGLYVLIDEYDNFANEVMTADPEAYHDLVHTEGPFKYLFKWVKSAMARKGLDRLFIAGVSPIVMSDLTSGMNIAENVYLYPELNTLCGFTNPEVRRLLEDLHAEKAAAKTPLWTVEDARAMLRDWYDGYRFADSCEDAVYNPTLVLYFLKHLLRTDAYPDQMLDSNLAADEGKLNYIARAAAGQDAVIDLIRKEKPLEVRAIQDRFTLRSMLEHRAQDSSFLGSYLYYFGMLTLKMGKTEAKTLELVVPNEVTRGLYLERIRQTWMPLGASRSAADALLFAFLRSGELEPLLDFIEATLFPTFSNRDATWANELTVKTLFLTLLWNDRAYITHSEAELHHRYADLCLLRRPDARTLGLWDLLFEFKRLPLKEVKLAGKEIQAATRQELMELVPVKKALDEAEIQLTDDRQTLEERYGDDLRLRAWSVVALGFERLVVRAST